MATLEEVYESIASDEEQRKAFVQAAGDERALVALLKEHGCEATPEEVKAFLAKRQTNDGRLSDGELSSVTGGCDMEETVCPDCHSKNWTIGYNEVSYYRCLDCGKIW